jgi:hypothetical protein
MRTNILVLAVLLLPIRSAVGQSSVPEPVIDSAVCPFECCHFGDRRAEGRVVARVRPAPGAPSAYVISRGEVVRADHGDLRSAHPGKLVLRVPLRNPTAIFHPGVGDTIVIIGYYGEGQYGFRWHSVTVGNELWDAVGDTPDADRPLQVLPPNGTWWVQVTNRAGKSGWINAGHLVPNGFTGNGPGFSGSGGDSCADRAGNPAAAGATWTHSALTRPPQKRSVVRRADNGRETMKEFLVVSDPPPAVIRRHSDAAAPLPLTICESPRC